MMLGISTKLFCAIVLAWLAIFGEKIVNANGGFNYQDALTKSLIFLEAQRSGKLPPNHRPPWRGDSALQDGKLANVDLVGGYYDAGDNVKFGLPMAFTVTTLACGTIFYNSELKSTGELQNAQDAIRWGADYLLKASNHHDRLYVQVGDPVLDHQCWIRPENMQTPRTVLNIDPGTPGTEIAAETAAALAASSIVFKSVDHTYSHSLLNRAKLLFDFAKLHKGTYDGECPFYCSYSGYNDELLWAATWLYMASKKSMYLEYIQEEAISASVSEFSWDLKYAGAQVLLSKLHFNGQKGLEGFKQHADNYICSVLPESPYHQVNITPGGMINLRDGANAQYVTGAALVFSLYSDVLAKNNQVVQCGNQQFNSAHLMAFSKQQNTTTHCTVESIVLFCPYDTILTTYKILMDYLLGKNPKGRSYMVGFGQNPPLQAHHRGASVPVLSESEAANVKCALTFNNWYSKNIPNPNELTGAIVGGPDRNDDFDDLRSKSSMTEPTTYTNSLAVGVLAKLAAYHK